MNINKILGCWKIYWTYLNTTEEENRVSKHFHYVHFIKTSNNFRFVRTLNNENENENKNKYL